MLKTTVLTYVLKTKSRAGTALCLELINSTGRFYFLHPVFQ